MTLEQEYEQPPSVRQRIVEHLWRRRHRDNKKTARVKRALSTRQTGETIVVKGVKRKRPVPKRIRRSGKRND